VADQSLDGFLSSLRRSTPTPVLAARRRRSTDARKRR
jgi:hypothetical protein